MKISARNQIAGRVTANIIEEAIADRSLAEGDKVSVLVKASDVAIGK